MDKMRCITRTMFEQVTRKLNTVTETEGYIHTQMRESALRMYLFTLCLTCFELFFFFSFLYIFSHTGIHTYHISYRKPTMYSDSCLLHTNVHAAHTHTHIRTNTQRNIFYMRAHIHKRYRRKPVRRQPQATATAECAGGSNTQSGLKLNVYNVSLSISGIFIGYSLFLLIVSSFP